MSIISKLKSLDGASVPPAIAGFSVSIEDADGTQCCISASEGVISISALGTDESNLNVRSLNTSILDSLTFGGWASDVLGVEARAGDMPWAPLYPFDTVRQPSEGRTIPNLNIAVQHTLLRSPIGHLRFTDRFENGILVGRTPGVGSGSSAIVEMTYENSVAAREAGVSVLERIADATVYSRNVASLQLVAGLYEEVELSALLARRQIVNRQLACLAVLTWSDAWKRVADGKR